MTADRGRPAAADRVEGDADAAVQDPADVVELGMVVDVPDHHALRVDSFACQ